VHVSKLFLQLLLISELFSKYWLKILLNIIDNVEYLQSLAASENQQSNTATAKLNKFNF